MSHLTLAGKIEKPSQFWIMVKDVFQEEPLLIEAGLKHNAQKIWQVIDADLNPVLIMVEPNGERHKFTGMHVWAEVTQIQFMVEALPDTVMKVYGRGLTPGEILDVAILGWENNRTRTMSLGAALAQLSANCLVEEPTRPGTNVGKGSRKKNRNVRWR